MKIIAFAATNSRHSINKALASYAGQLLITSQQDIELEVLDLNDFELPIFSIDIEKELGQPDNAKAFFNKLTEADALIISFAEYNGTYTAVWKNLFDWCTRIDKVVFQNKPTLILSTSPGPRGGLTVMEQSLGSLPRFGAEIKAHLSVPNFFDNFSQETKELTNPELRSQLQVAANKLIS